MIWPFAARSKAAGLEFIDEDGGGPGVRLRKRQAKKPNGRTFSTLRR
jgi:hypothetical protein